MRHNPDTQVTETASNAGATAWTWARAGVQGMFAAGAQTNHYYFAVTGTTVICLQFTQLADASVRPIVRHDAWLICVG